MEQRKLKLVADFEHSEYADGWYMAVGSCFRDALDIKWTKRRTNKKEIYCWTQGTVYNFKEGDIIYDSPGADKRSWRDALSSVNIAVQVNSATPASGERNKGAGWVRFEIFLLNEEKEKMSHWGVFDCNQKEFVSLMRTGTGRLLSGDKFSLPKKNV